MNEIMEFEGLDPALFQRVGPLVMNPAVLKQNYNFPFRTTHNFRWSVAVEEGEVTGFIPVERRKNGWVINNYYMKGQDAALLSVLLDRIISVASEEQQSLTAVCFLKDRDVYREHGFEEVNLWKRYVKMVKSCQCKEYGKDSEECI